MKKNLFDWVLSVMTLHRPYPEEQSFNVHIYSEEEKQKAIKQLTALNSFDAILSNNNNSLKVFAI